MSRPAPPVLTVQSDWSQRSFAPGRDVVVGSDLRADMRVAHPLIARAHLLLRFDRGKWIAIDNGSPTGIFVGGQRVRGVDVHDRQSINIGRPDGPRLTFEIGRHQGTVGQLPPTVEAVPVITPPDGPRPSQAQPPRRPGISSPRIVRPQPAPPRYPPAGGPSRAPYPVPQPAGPPQPPRSQPLTEIGAETLEASGFDSTNLRRAVQRSRSRLGAPPAGAAVIGRGEDSDVVISDVLASRHHAYLVPTPTGMEIHDAQSINGTFVNGT
ncbi:FHA domain-containing protein, partial [Mycobacterium sp.]